MLAIERKNRILSILQDEKKVVVGELSKRFDVSEETIRRDLDKLEKEGYVVKAYGGAVINDNQLLELPFIVRKKANVSAKQKISEILETLIHDGDKIILDASSTALFAMKRIKDKKNITLITNSVEILLEAADVTGWNVYSTGGAMQEGSLALFGTAADKMLETYQVDKAILSCKGLDVMKGLTDSNDMHANTKRCMLKGANKRIIAVDSSKFDKIAFCKVADFDGVDVVVTDSKPQKKWLDMFEKCGVECIYEVPERGE